VCWKSQKQHRERERVSEEEEEGSRMNEW
jgi:hypothetical protein